MRLSSSPPVVGGRRRVKSDGVAGVSERDSLLVADELAARWPTAGQRRGVGGIGPWSTCHQESSRLRRRSLSGNDDRCSCAWWLRRRRTGGEASGPAICWTVCEGVGRECCVCWRGEHDVCAEAAEFFVELLVEVGVEREQRGGYACGDGHGDEGGDAARAAMDERAAQDAGKVRCVILPPLRR